MKVSVVVPLLAGVLTQAACGAALPTLDQPFNGPGWDTNNNTLRDASPRQLVAAATHLRVRQEDPRTHPTFMRVMRPIDQELEHAPGLVGHATRVLADLSEDWTLSVWESEEDMAAFVMSNAHQDAIEQMAELSRPSTVVMWHVESSEMPLDWADAEAQLQAQGRDAFGNRQFVR